MINKFGFIYCAVFSFITGMFSIAYHLYDYTPVQGDFIDIYGVAVLYAPLILVVMGFFFYLQLKFETKE